MTKFFIIFFSFLKIVFVGQNKSMIVDIVSTNTDKYIGHDSVYAFVDKPAEFLRGISAMKKYISDKQRLSDTIIATCVYKMTGTAFIKFIVEKDGSLNDIRVLKGVSNCEACDEEAINIVKSMPKWKPATLGDKIVKSYFNLPIIYRP